MEKIHQSGKVKSIGLSNHLVHHMEELLREATIVPVVNQIELHPILPRRSGGLLQSENIIVQSWSPLGGSKIPLMQEDTLKEIGRKYDKSPAQVVLRLNVDRDLWSFQIIQYAATKENIAIFDFQLTAEDIALIDKLNKDYRTGIHPDKISF